MATRERRPQLGSSVIDPDLAYSAGDGMLYCAYTELIGGIYSLFVAQRGL